MYYTLFRLGEWLNGRAAVSKTAGCVFESRLPCQIEKGVPKVRLFLFNKSDENTQVVGAFALAKPFAENKL